MESQNSQPVNGASLAQSQKARVRSVAYPSETLNFCIDLVTKVQKIFGGATYATREQIAAQIGVSASHIATQVSSCVQYGLLELKSNEGYKPTQLFTAIYKPLNDAEARSAKIQCFQTPQLYQNLIEDLKGELPTPGGLAVILFRKHKVSENASKIAADTFLENVHDLNLVDANGYLRKDLTNIPTEEQENDEIPFIEIPGTAQPITPTLQIPQHPPQPNTNILTVTPQVGDAPPIPVFLADGRMAKVIMPIDATPKDFKRVGKVISGYSNDDE